MKKGIETEQDSRLLAELNELTKEAFNQNLITWSERKVIKRRIDLPMYSIDHIFTKEDILVISRIILEQLNPSNHKQLMNILAYAYEVHLRKFKVQ